MRVRSWSPDHHAVPDLSLLNADSLLKSFLGSPAASRGPNPQGSVYTEVSSHTGATLSLVLALSHTTQAPRAPYFSLRFDSPGLSCLCAAGTLLLLPGTLVPSSQADLLLILLEPLRCHLPWGHLPAPSRDRLSLATAVEPFHKDAPSPPNTSL